MKKLLSIILSVFILFALEACAGTTQNDGASQTNEPTAEAIGASDENDTADSKKTLIAYFSNTGNTETIAEHIADITGGDLFEIVPEEPYTDEDLDYNDSSSRATLEQSDSTARPAIATEVENIEQYNIVYIGYPIWWGDAPKIISTFLESYNFSDKTIIPFCTSASSGIGSSALDLHSLASGADWEDGRRFLGNAEQSEVESWIESLDLDE